MHRTTWVSRLAGIDLILERLGHQDSEIAQIKEAVQLANGRTRTLEEHDTTRFERERLAEVARTEHSAGWGQLRATLAGVIATGMLTAILHFTGVL